ncbi:MAG: DedA family protein [Acidimicrobiales bacterium]|jgi:membrane protein DedA with SNARE-associated domain
MTHLVDTWGYWAVALFVLAESFGVPLPGETALIVAGAYAGHSHRLSPWLIFVVAAASAVAGGELGYLLGRFGGYRLVRRWGHKVRLDERKLRISRYLFDTHGSKVVFFGRFVTILRTYAALLAGTSRMKALPFAAANAAGALLWAGIFTYASYVAGNTLRRMSSTITWVLVGVAVAVIASTIVFARHRMEELAVRADAAYADRDE